MSSALLRIGLVAKRASVSVDTIRYYERLGLLPKPSRTPAGYREYPDNTVDRIRLVRNAVRFGFSLREISGFLRVRDTGGKPCYQVRAAARQILERVDRQIAELTATRETMRETLQTWDQRLATTPADRPARLLDGLASTPGPKPRHNVKVAG